jgi:hypothetical protein
MALIRPNNIPITNEEWAELAEEFAPFTEGECEGIRLAALDQSPEGRALACWRFVRYSRRARDIDHRMDPERVARSASGAPTVRRTLGGPAERMHVRAIADRIARLANADAAVLNFRSSLGLPPKGLPEPDARATLRSPLLRFWTKHDLDGMGIPLLGHEAAIVREWKKGGQARVSLRVSWGNRKRIVTFGWPLPASEPVFVEFPGEKGHREFVEAGDFSVLGEVGRASESLAFRAPFNTLERSSVGALAACTWLLLTGEALPLALTEASRTIPGTVDVITVHALARVASPEAVAAEYRAMQRRVLKDAQDNRTGRKGRSVRRRSFEVVGFVERELRGPALDLPAEQWRVLRLAWNRAHPRQRFGEPREIRRVYESAVAALFPNPGAWAVNALAVVEAEISRRRPPQERRPR